MSWDVLLLKVPKETARPEDVPDDYLPPGVGSRAEVTAAVRKLFRGSDSDGESFVSIERSGFAIEVSLGDDEPCSQLLLNVHDDDEAATKAILRLADHFGMRAIDCSTSEFIEATTGKKARDARRKATASRRKEFAAAGQEPEHPPLKWLSGVVLSPCNRVVYLSYLAGESPKQLQKALIRHWRMGLGKDPEMDAMFSGPQFVLTLPDGEPLGDIRVTRLPTKVTETEAEMMPRVQKGAALVHAFAKATGRRSGEIEGGSIFVCDDGRRIPLVECAYRRLRTDADHSRKVKGTKRHRVKRG